VRALCDFGFKATREPWRLEEPDVDELRAQGWSDTAISDAIQVISYFNYINRVADAVGIDDEPEWAGG
jgi:alkylhydroperoxidase family enzyme